MSREVLASSLGRINLVRKSNGALIYRQRGGNQSTVDADGISVDTYIHALYGLLLQTAARSVLVIGCGGGLLATMLVKAGRRAHIVDIDPASFRIARRHFGLPRDVPGEVADGLAFLRTTRRRFDAIVLDAFIGEDIPAQFFSDDFAAGAQRCLRAGGVLLVNVCLGRGQDAADRMARLLKAAGWRSRLLDRAAAERNAIVAAGEVRGLRPPKLLVAPAIELKRLKDELAAMRFRRVRNARKRVARRSK